MTTMRGAWRLICLLQGSKEQSVKFVEEMGNYEMSEETNH